MLGEYSLGGVAIGEGLTGDTESRVMSYLTHRLELNATATDYASFAIGEDIGAISSSQGRSARLIWRPTDRSFQNEPTSGQVIAQCNGSQVGWQLDAGFEDGVCRLIIVSVGAVTIRTIRFSMPQGDTPITITFLNNGSNNWTVSAYVDNRLVGTDTSTYSGGIASSQTAITLGARSGPADHLNVGSYVRAEYWTSALSAGEVTTVYADGRPQDTAGPARAADVRMGSSVGDTATTAVDQTGNGRNLTLVGTWATAGFTRWDPPRRVGLQVSTTGTSTTGWDDFGNATISSGAAGVTITTSSTDVRACAIYTAFPCLAPNWMARAVVRVATAGAGVIGLGTTPFRTNAGSVACFINLVSGISSIYAGEFTTDFGDAEVARSTVPEDTGTTPTSGGSDVLLNSGTSSGDDYELIVRLDGNQVTFWCRNLTDNGLPLRLAVALDHAIGTSGLRHSPPSPGYLSVFNLLSTTTVQVISLEQWSNTVEKPYCAYLTHSLANVGETEWAQGYVMALNALRFADGIYDWIELVGRPGGTIAEFTDFDAITNEVRNVGAVNVAMCNAANTLGQSGDAVAEADTIEWIDRMRLTWPQMPNHTRLICEPPMTLGSETTLDWRTNLTNIAASYTSGVSTSFAMHQGMGNPPGTNTQESTDFVGGGDNVHLSPAGHVRAAGFLHSGASAVFPPAFLPPKFSPRAFNHYLAR